jgi:hypothetical protein
MVYKDFICIGRAATSNKIRIFWRIYIDSAVGTENVGETELQKYNPKH